MAVSDHRSAHTRPEGEHDDVVVPLGGAPNHFAGERYARIESLCQELYAQLCPDGLSGVHAIESWAPAKAVRVNTEVLEWIAAQMRSKRCSNRTLKTLVATIVGVAALPLVQMPNVFDIGM